MYIDSTILIILPGLILGLLASSMVRNAYARYAKVQAASGITAAQMAEQMLRQGGAYDVRVERISGQLTDHYDPRDQVLRLSDGVYGSTSIAALGIAAHETGHALQHQEEYKPLWLRTAIVPVVNITSNAAWPIFFLGLLFSWQPLVTLGIVFFGAAVVFSLITLPVEFNASARAVRLLEDGGFLTREENVGAKKVLNAAAMTYVASALAAILQLARMLVLSGRSRRND